MSSAVHEETRAEEAVKLPMAGLLALFTAGFLGIINETIPAGLLPEMAKGMGVSESVAGQTVTVYALATALTAIPLNGALRNWGRRNVLVSALVAFALANTVAASTSSFPVVLAARFVAGAGAGLIWSNIGGYAARIVPAQFQGKAIAIAMAGTPVALSLGLPAGTFLGDATGWQATFGVVAAASAALIAWVFAVLPDLPGRPAGGHVPVTAILRNPGVRPLLWVVAGFMVAHNILYTYIGPLADRAGAGGRLEWVLLVFGLAALLSIWLTGAHVDPHHRRLTVMSAVVLGASAVVLGLAGLSPVVLYAGVAAWGFGFGGSATLFVTAGIRAAGTDGVQSVLVTVFNLSIAAGGVFGGLLLAGFGVASIPWVAVALMIPTAATTVAARRHAFPHWPRRP
ncbi:MFS transporter [Actinacidiphila guanduensis]|uniref:Predicted arabinose efflux permease, MFS family n=1 Tax=Actinacidiphila guanduensis TaxID=310781 RepID=A0A1H0NCY3_9ACTN|nr:MFS transporter [Actinacidiphila guanduensis]SDO90609.1 Predicted arabinose efflux permease, MFS family [Actinacidiphila guanduensis]